MAAPTSMMSSGKALLRGLRGPTSPVQRIERGPKSGGSYIDRENRKIVIARGSVPGESPIHGLHHEAGHLTTGSLKAMGKADESFAKGNFGRAMLHQLKSERLASRAGDRMAASQGVSVAGRAPYRKEMRGALSTYKHATVGALVAEAGENPAPISTSVREQLAKARSAGASEVGLVRAVDKFRRKSQPGFALMKKHVSAAHQGELRKSFGVEIDASNREQIRRGLVRLNRLVTRVSHFSAGPKPNALAVALLRKILSP